MEYIKIDDKNIIIRYDEQGRPMDEIDEEFHPNEVCMHDQFKSDNGNNPIPKYTPTSPCYNPIEDQERSNNFDPDLFSSSSESENETVYIIIYLNKTFLQIPTQTSSKS